MTWLPGLVVLAIGLGAGWLMARGFQRAKGKASRPGGGRLELEIADLETRRDELYERLREIQRGEGPEEDRQPLELAAARTLRELDRLQGELTKTHPKAARKRERAQAAEPRREAGEESAAPVPSSARQFVTGFAYGAGLLLLIGGLVYWAVRDAKPRPDESAPMSSPAPAEDAHDDLSGLPPAIAAKVASLEAHLATAPDDLDARKELGYTYLGAGRFVEGYRQGEEILARAPEDPDGLYMQGLVRLTMGQVETAEELLSRALDSDPNHVDSLTTTGVIRLQMGNYQEAIAFWKRGLAAIGGSNAMIERLIRMAEEGRSPEEILGVDSGPEPEPDRPKTAEEILGLDPRAAESQPAPAAAPATPAAPAGGDVITLTLELAPGATATPGSILFVMLRGAAGGPPVAVKRIGAPTFPMTLTLGQEDSMMGAPIPETGTVTARLDVDGSASTRDPRDLEASAEVSAGASIALRLSSGS